MSYSHFSCPVFLSSARIMPLQELTTSRSPTTVGVENTQPPVSNSQRTGGSWVFADVSGFWAATSPGKRRRTTKPKFRTLTATSNRESTFLFLYSWLTILSRPKYGQAWVSAVIVHKFAQSFSRNCVREL